MGKVGRVMVARQEDTVLVSVLEMCVRANMGE